jgi:hypothetical protein
MPRSIVMLWTVCANCVLSGALPSAEAPKPQAREASPIKALQGAAASFKKVTSYRVKLDVAGGYSESVDHSLSERVVQENYSGDVYGGIMSLAKERVYRTQKGGTVFVTGEWRDIFSDPKSVKTVRLFRFPEVVIANALKHAPRGAKWVDPPKEEAGTPAKDRADSDEAGADAADDGAKDGEKAAEAGKAGAKADPKAPPRTTVKGPAKAAGKAAAVDPKGPWIITVTAPPEEALAHIIEVQNSNCFGGG